MINQKIPKAPIILVLLVFSLVINKINAQGPNAPEAASFEPVDATDMVNLLTGDFTYVLPLLNVPSPEGGYPIALSYHAGIAMDQEASWVGLGWNINTGAINRSVNGYPDDYNYARIDEYFYDEGETRTMSEIGVSYSSFGGPSMGLNFSWGSHQSLGGSVSIGLGFGGGLGINASVGTNGGSLGAGYTSQSGLSLGISASTNGTISTSVGIVSNEAGFRIGASSDGSTSIVFSSGSTSGSAGSLGFNLSSEGVGLSLSFSTSNNKGWASGGVGLGPNSSYSSTISQGAYTSNQSGYTVPLFVPTPIGVFSLSFGKREIDYYAAEKTVDRIVGPLHFDKAPNNIVGPTLTTRREYMDIYEIPLEQSNLLNSEYNVTHNNPVFPNYDKFNVQSQGLSGTIHAKLTDNGSLKGVNKQNGIVEGFSYTKRYVINTIDNLRGDYDEYLEFTNKPQFYFDNEISSYFSTSKATFHDINDISYPELFNPLKTYSHGVNDQNIEHLKRSKHIEYYTNDEILNSSRITNEGLLLSGATGFDRSKYPLYGIGAYKITAADGKTYHYSLPVYNYEKVSRTYGMSSIHKGEPEYKAYLEKRELEPYATHWFLTAITGPDFIDNGNGVADEGDLGYWVGFEYGLWDDAFVWQRPYGKEYHIDENDPDIKTWIRGVKQQYFLDRVKTRTHTALFLKNEREDARSPYWQYWSVDHKHEEKQTGNDYVERFTIPQHKTLRLDKIILVKNEHDVANKSIGGNEGSDNVEINFPWDSDLVDPISSSTRIANYSLKSNVFDWTDNWQEVKDNAIKVICFGHTNTGDNVLVKGTPYTGVSTEGRLTLTGVYFDGKQGTRVMPPYKFSYINDIDDTEYIYNDNNKDDWGYNFLKPEIWSLNEIVTPTGGKVLVDYEPNEYRSLTSHEVVLRNKDKTIGARDANGHINFPSKSILNLQVNDIIDLNISYSYDIAYDSDVGSGSRLRKRHTYKFDKYEGQAIIREINRPSNSDTYTIKADPTSSIVTETKYVYSNCVVPLGCGITESYNEGNCVELKFNTSNLSSEFYTGAGVRVKSIATTDDTNIYTSEYKYGENQDGIGWVSYIPFAPESGKEIPHSFELPAPKPMYEYVKHESLDNEGEITGSTLYKFNVMNQSSTDKIKYGEFYELNVNRKDELTIENRTPEEFISIAAFEIKDNLNSIGQLLSVSNFNSKNQLSSKLINEYYQPEELLNNLGKVQESYQSYKQVGYIRPAWLTWDIYKSYVNSSTRIKYPSLLKSSTEYKNGYSYTTRFDNFDPVSGQAKEVYSFSSNGSELKVIGEPAFRKYAEMGSKADNIENKNMLSQEAETLSYFRTSSIGDWKLYNAEIETWKDWGSDIWRKYKSFAWKGNLNDDGSYQNFTSFNWNGENATQAEGWQKLSEVTKYDDFSRILEIEDINENYVSTKTCDNESKVLAVSNAAYTDMYYSGAEYYTDDSEAYFDGQVRASTQSDLYAHSGFYSIIIGTNLKGFEVNLPSDNNRIGLKSKFKVSVWAKTDNYSNARVHINGVTRLFNGEKVFAGEWVQLNHYEELSNGEETVYVTSVSGKIRFDDFRLYPATSSMTSYVYNQWDELWYIIGDNGLASKFEYDAAGRLIKTYTEIVDDVGIAGGFKPISENKYNYKFN